MPKSPCARMTGDQLSAFVAAVESDPGLQDKLSTAASDYAVTVVAIAARAGFAITAEQVQAAQNAYLPTELSEDDLSGVVGGAMWPISTTATNWSFIQP